MAQHVVPSLHTTFLPAECHNLLVQYFILLVWLHWLFSVKTLVCHLFFCGSIGKENRESWNRTACLQTLVTSPAPWLDTGSWVVFGVSQQMKYLSANLEGPIQAAGVHGKAAHTLHVESKAQCAPSEGTQEPFVPPLCRCSTQGPVQSEEADSLLQTSPKIPLVPWDVDYINTGHNFFFFWACYNWTTSAFWVNQNSGIY